MDKPTVVKFIKKHRIYNVGEIAGFSGTELEALISAGFAVPLPECATDDPSVNDPSSQEAPPSEPKDPATEPAGNTNPDAKKQKGESKKSDNPELEAGSSTPEAENGEDGGGQEDGEGGDNTKPLKSPSISDEEAAAAVADLKTEMLGLPEAVQAALLGANLSTVKAIQKFESSVGLKTIEGLGDAKVSAIHQAIDKAKSDLVK